MFERARLNKILRANAARGRRTGTAMGIAFAVTLLATGAQAQNCTLENPTKLNFAGAGF